MVKDKITSRDSRIDRWLEALGLEDVASIRRVIVDVGMHEPVKVYVTRGADAKAFDLAFEAGDFSVVEVEPSKPKWNIRPSGNQIDVCRCARCGGDHAAVVFAPFKRSAGEWTHWGTCPQTREPILLNVVGHSDSPGPEKPASSNGEST